MKTYTLDWERYVALARQTAAEGSVLVRNEGAALPLRKGERVSVFGRIQLDYYKSGTGSGGMVNVNYVHGILDGLLACEDITVNQELLNTYRQWADAHPFDVGKGWGGEPWCQEEMPLAPGVVEAAAEASDAAVIIIGRTAGEDHDNSADPGSYLLTGLERDMLQKVCGAFSRTVVVLNVGNIIDMNWVEEYKPGAVLYAWQGGMEGGMGTARVLTGQESPSGKLPDTIARSLSDYPSHATFGDPVRNYYQEDIYVGYRYFETVAREKVLYPFGFGLSYTSFSIEGTLSEQAGTVTFEVTVKNTGSLPGKEVAQVYCRAPQGKLGKPARSLAAFGKTAVLAPGGQETLVLSVKKADLASFDDSGVTGFPFAYVLEAGDYEFYLGSDVRSAVLLGAVTVEQTTVTRQLEEALAPVMPFSRMKVTQGKDGTLRMGREETPLRKEARRHRDKGAPSCLPYSGDMGHRLAHVKQGDVALDTFLAQLSDRELCCLVYGEGMSSPKVTPGTAAAFGGVTEALAGYGIPIACCTDGPSGMRMDCGTNAFSLPNGTMLASTFNTALVADLFEMEGLEMRNNRVDTLLGPGINIHRHPLNGRNFEYHSEDPFLTGRMACAQLEGMHRAGVTGTIKHFCANNQEFKRTESDSVVSQRALREIYLKGYEMAVTEAGAQSVMTSYGAVNGVWTAGNYDLVTHILRKEWGFDGIVMTDWWAQMNEEGQPPSRQNLASMVKAQNDLYMVTPNAETAENNLEEALKSGRMTRGELVRCAENICRFLLRFPVMERAMGIEAGVEIVGKPADQNITADFDITYHSVAGKAVIDTAGMATAKGSSNLLAVTFADNGIYRISLTASSPLEQVAQLPVSVFNDERLFAVYSFNGSGGVPVTLQEEGVIFGPNHYFRFYFSQSGLTLHSVTFEKIGDLPPRP